MNMYLQSYGMSRFPFLWLPKSEEIPFLTGIYYAAFTDRERISNPDACKESQCDQRSKNGRNYLIFPEGTRRSKQIIPEFKGEAFKATIQGRSVPLFYLP